VTVGILALQGDVREHAGAFAEVGVETRPVRRPADLRSLAGIVLPGGESTTLSMLLESSGLYEPIAALLDAGLPAFGTCAGLVLLARTVLDGRPDQRSFGVLDCTVRRNGYGSQRYSFESVLRAPALADGAAGGLPAVFIRAPVVEEVGPEVEILATLEAGPGTRPARVPDPVVCRQGPVLACAFHPELTGDRRLHRLFARMAGERYGAGNGAGNGVGSTAG
jgi:pyridoxal 5'-phosphate synthase pdxT subunit